MKIISMAAATVFLFCLQVHGAQADSVYGRVTYVGVVKDLVEDGEYHARFRFRVSHAACIESSGQKYPNAKKTWWFRVNSGGMSNDVLMYRAPNVRNAYETVLDGFLANTGIQVEAPSVDCSDVGKASVIIDLLSAQIGIYR